MIKLVAIRAIGPDDLELEFSDGSSARWSGASLIARDTELTRPLADPAYFARAFIEAGALAWPNGLEFSAHSLHHALGEAGKAGPEGGVSAIRTRKTARKRGRNTS